MADLDTVTTALAQRIEALPALSDAEAALSLMADVERFQAAAREAKRQLEAALIQFIDANGDIELGDKRWYVGHDKSYKRRTDLEVAVSALLEATGGDVAAFCGLLSSGALKPAACRLVLGERFADHFETVVERDLKTGAPRRAVKVHDARFAK